MRWSTPQVPHLYICFFLPIANYNPLSMCSPACPTPLSVRDLIRPNLLSDRIEYSQSCLLSIIHSRYAAAYPWLHWVLDNAHHCRRRLSAPSGTGELYIYSLPFMYLCHRSMNADFDFQLVVERFSFDWNGVYTIQPVSSCKRSKSDSRLVRSSLFFLNVFFCVRLTWRGGQNWSLFAGYSNN